jgi:hypothetical protein
MYRQHCQHVRYIVNMYNTLSTCTIHCQHVWYILIVLIFVANSACIVMGSVNRAIAIVGNCVVITCSNNIVLFEASSPALESFFPSAPSCKAYLYYILIIFGWLSANSCRLLLPGTWKHWLLFGEVTCVTFFNTTVFYKAEEVWLYVSPHSCKSEFTSKMLKLKIYIIFQ